MATKNHLQTKPIGSLWKKALLIFVLTMPVFLLAACQTNKPKPETEQQPSSQKQFIYQDSTQYFASKTASISMRATLENDITAGNDKTKPLIIQPLTRGYQLQFRSIQKNNILVENVSIIAGGKRFLIVENSFLLNSQKPITLQLTLADTKFINQQKSATLQFKYNKKSVLYHIKSHQLEKFTP